MGKFSYLDFLAKFGVGGAHPGGILLTKELFENETITNSSAILDAGCGTGLTAAYLHSQFGAQVTGLEINPIMIEKARRRFSSFNLPIQVIQGSIEDISIADNTFDFIVCESVLAFVKKQQALSEFYRILKSGGRLIANEMTIDTHLTAEEEKEIMSFYDVDSLLLEEDWEKILQEAGFRQIQIESKAPSFHSDQQMPEFHFSADVEPELFEVMNQHAQIVLQYQNTLSYRILTCTKP